MAMDEIKVIRGDDREWSIIFKNDAGTAIDLTGYTIYFTVRESVPEETVITDADAAITKTITTGGISGIVTLTLTGTDTDIPVGDYFYDIQFKKSGKITSSGVGNFIVEPDITRAR